jgi:hypothetical protein
MWRVRHVLAPLALVGAGLALGACGGDSSPELTINAPTETQPSLGKTQFISQADSACSDVNSQIEQFAAAGQGESEAAQIAQLRQGLIDQIKQLSPPNDPNLDQFLKAMGDQVSAGQKIGLAVQRGEDPSQFETQLDTAKSDAQQAASAFGFKECGAQISSSSSSTSTGAAGATGATGGTVSPSAPSTGPPSGTAGGTSGGSTGGGTAGGGTTGGGSTGGGSTGSTGGSSGGVGPGQ